MLADTCSPVAVLMSVYAGDTLAAFSAATESIIQQQDVDRAIRIYLAVDGPLAPDVENWLSENSQKMHLISRSRRNLGLAKSLNRIIMLLDDEEYIFRMDSDDLCLPNRFSLQINYLDSNRYTDILGGAVIEQDVESREFRLCHYPLTHDQILKKLVRLCPVAHPTVVFRKHVLDVTGGYPLARTTQDLAMWFECLQKGFQFANLPQPLVIMNVDRAFYDRRSLKKGWREFRIYLNGIRRTQGYSWVMIYPFARLATRMAPVWVRRRVYRSSLRRPQTSLDIDTDLAVVATQILGKRQRNV